MEKHILFLSSLFLLNTLLFPQENNAGRDTIEIYLIDSFVTLEQPQKFKLTFLTSEECISKLIIEDKYEYLVSTQPTENHFTEIDITKLSFKNKAVPFYIVIEDAEGNVYKGERYEFIIPQEKEITTGSNTIVTCLFGSIVFALPSPAFISKGGDSYFALSKEIPLFTFFSGRFKYPFGYVSAEYTYIFNSSAKNYYRAGYKQIIELPLIEYVSPGINYFTDFKGMNGVSTEVSVGLFRIVNVFTLYARYRFNFEINNFDSNFHEASIGLFSSFFSLNF